MARMFPALSDQQLNELQSAAEADLYRAFRDQLPDAFEVHYSVSWILRREEDQARDGEADFLVCHPDRGFLVIEVKGGGVGFDGLSGEWFSIDASNQKHIIKDPIRQALRAKYSILTKLREHPKFRSYGLSTVLCGHTVFFPDIAHAGKLEKPDLPLDIVGTNEHLHEAEKWVITAFDYWAGESDRTEPLERAGVGLIRELFARSFEARPLLSRTLEKEEQQRLRLTHEQARILDILRGQRRVAVSGGAGTGKTVLAVEKARRLANEGFNTLLTCYNRQLADHLSIICQDTDRLDVMSFHQLCVRQVKRANQASGRDLLQEAKVTYPGTDLWNVQYPNALGYSIEVLNEFYDAIVCDEGQDFGDDYWVPLELFLSDYEKSPFYIFFDDNQNLYHRTSSFPIKDEPFCLTVNCRNTDKIHDVAYHYYKGTPIDPPEIQGQDVVSLSAPNIDAQANKIHSRIVDLLNNEGLEASDIVVLIADAYSKSEYYEAIRHKPLPKGTSWLEEGTPSTGRLLIDTVNRFKGLEATTVFLWGLDGIELSRNMEILYVGMSRAKSLLFLVGQQKVCDEILSMPAQ